MKAWGIVPAAVLAVGSVTSIAQTEAPVTASAKVVLPADTMFGVTPVDEITSKGMKEGDTRTLQAAADVVQNGVVVIPRGSLVKATVTYRTGKGIVGKSAKFELTFNTVAVGGKVYQLKGKHRQEGKGNTVGALLGSMIITGKSAVMVSGQVVNAFTAEAIPST